jgi:hypothetical protein
MKNTGRIEPRELRCGTFGRSGRLARNELSDPKLFFVVLRDKFLDQLNHLVRGALLLNATR